MKSTGRPFRISKFVAVAKTMREEDAAAMGYDEFKGALFAVGADPQKIATMKDESLTHIRMIRGMSDQDGFDFAVNIFKTYCSELGVDESVIHSLQFE